MPRPIKDGLDDFPFDVDTWSDPKIIELEATYGEPMVNFIAKIFPRIYKGGYYFRLTKENIKDFCLNSLRKPVNDFHVLVKAVIAEELFDVDKFNKYNILTSVRIQRTFFYKTRRREGNTLFKEYWIESVSIDKNAISVYNIDGELLYYHAAIKKKRVQKDEEPVKTKKQIQKDSINMNQENDVSKVNGSKKIMIEPMVNSTMYAYQDVEAFCSQDYHSQTDLFKEQISASDFETYAKFYSMVKTNYARILDSSFQLTISEFKKLMVQPLNGKVPTKKEIEGACRKLAGNGVQLQFGIYYKLLDYIGYYREDQQKEHNKSKLNGRAKITDGHTPSNGYGSF